jgi:Zn-dependent protease with chaperone function
MKMALLSAAGTFALIWMLLWALFTFALGLVYPGLRRLIFAIHPAHGSVFALLFWTAPVLLSLLATLLLLFPLTEGILISSHCHGVCENHVPGLGGALPALAGVLLAAILLLGLSGNFVLHLLKGRQMLKRFEFMSVDKAGFRLLDTLEPVVFTLGWLRPRVFISRGLLAACSAQQLAVILVHEQAHRQRKDNLRLLLGRIFSMALPGSWRASAQHDLHLLAEQSCDYAAARKFGAFSVAETIVHVGRTLKLSPGSLPAVAFAGSDLESRVMALLDSNQRQALRWWHGLCIVMMVMLAIAVSLEPLHHGVEWFFGLLE